MAGEKEIPMDFNSLEELAGSRMPGFVPKLTPIELLMAAPGETHDLSGIDKKEAVIDCIEMLTEQDQFIINAIIYEGLNYRMLSERLGVSTAHAWRLYHDALDNMKQLLLFDERITSYLGMGDDNG